MELNQRELQLMNTMMRFQRLRFSSLHPTLSKGEAWLLIDVCRAGAHGITVSKLAEQIQMPAPAVSRLLNSLEKQALIVRQIAPHDRRSIMVCPTDAGRQQTQAMLQIMRTFWHKVLQPIPEAQFESLLAGWNAVIDRMETVIAECGEQSNASKEAVK